MIDKIKDQIYKFLRKTQKYTGTDNVYLAKGGFWLASGQVIFSITSILLAIAMANLLSPEIYGDYKYLLSLMGTLSIFSLTGFSAAIVQATARGMEGSFYSGFKTKLKWGFLGSLAAIGGALYYWFRGNDTLPIPLLIMAIFLPLWQASGIYGSFLEGKKLFNVQVKYSTINQILSAGAIIATLFITKNLLWLVVAYFASHTFLSYFLYLLTKRKFKPNKKEDVQTIPYGMHLSVMGILSQAAAYLDKILIFTFIGPTQLAIYSFATAVPGTIQDIVKSIDILAIPKLSVRSKEEIRQGIMKKVWKLFLLMAITIIFYALAAPYIYKIFFHQYLSSIHYSQVFMLSFISLPASLLGLAFRAKMMKKELYLLKITPFVQVALLAILIPFYGIWGAIIAIVGAEIFGSALTFFLFRKF